VTLAPSTRLGPYQITASIGEGGMGEVYRARDTRLDRTVAIKVVGHTLASVDDRASLEQEGRAIAALNHPHICALYDIGEHDHRSFLVMEYVAGETLAARLARGPLPVREVIWYAIQIAEALDHAHRHDIVHRDLKPANVMLTDRGVKVLDFGLATLRAAAPLQMPLEATPIAGQQLASERLLLGTVQYMAPERLEGCEADTASDLFAFGAMMYEMAAGQRPFESNSPAGVIAAILRSEPPPPSTLRPELSPSIDWVIQKALAKNRDARWRAAGDIVEVLRWIARGPEPAIAAAPASRPRRLMPIVAIALVAGAAALLALAPTFRTPSAAPASIAFSILPPERGGFTATPSSVRTAQFALSPNGRRLAFVASVEHDASQLWVRELDALRPTPVAGTQGAEYPFWSPDGDAIGFFANGSLKRVDLGGGPPRVLAAAAHGRGGAWSRQGVILFAPDTQNSLFRIPAGGGNAAQVSHLEGTRHEASHRWPQFLADDRHFIYFVQSTQPEQHGIYLGDLGGAAPRRLLTSGLSAAYVAPDRLLFVSGGALMSAPFEWQREARVGEPSAIVSAVAGSSNFSAAVSVSQTGLLAYTSVAATSELVWVDRSGARVASLGAPAEVADFRLSPNGQQLAIAEVDVQSHHPDIRVLDLTRGAKLRLTADEATDAASVWSPDGKRIVFRSNRGGLHDLYEAPSNGSGTRRLLLRSEYAKYPTDFLPDGRGIVYHTFQGNTGSDIWLVSPDGTQAKPLVQTPFDEMQGQVSPDGQWLAYASFETGQAEIYVRSLVDPGSRWQVSAGGGTDPRWRGNGHELFYVSTDWWLTQVAFADGAPSAPKRLFEMHVAPPVQPYMSNYNVSPDADRFLVKVPVHDVASMPIHLLTNWPAARPRS
jgi:Tol biopolymer transport system component/predicted Ser/Thr protein kinase